MPGLKQERWNARPRNRICWSTKALYAKLRSIQRTFFRESRQLMYMFTGGKLSTERNDIKCISETKCTFGYLLSFMLKPKARLKDAQFIFCFFIAMFFYLFCILHIFVLLCLCNHHAYVNIFFWINILLFISETVNCMGYSSLHVLLLITCDRHQANKTGGFPMLYLSLIFKGKACSILQDYYRQPPTMWVEISGHKTKFIDFVWQNILSLD